MNHVLRLGAVFLMLVCLFPPWVQTVHRGQVLGSEPLGYAWVFTPPKPKIKANPILFNPNFNPDALSRLPDDPLQKLPETNENSFAMQGIAVGVDLSRLLVEAVALGALVGLGMTFARKRPA